MGKDKGSYPEFPPNYKQAECCATCKLSQDQLDEIDLESDFFQCKKYKPFCNDNRTLVLYSEVNVCDEYKRSESFVEKMDMDYLKAVQAELKEFEETSDEEFKEVEQLLEKSYEE